MNKISVSRGLDGFGSQFLSVVSCMIYAKKYNMEYVHQPFSGIKLVGMNNFTNIPKLNGFINNIVFNLGYKLNSLLLSVQLNV